ncbi:hypothetical protein POTOM_014198 [Populus tomentosa]|uniref:Arp2/3 complex 34 kDa subunit n=1 Tax=Populus tomentosa TaxID=118781 RepID=A0A8X8A463_POPTO|nr:hypothetical protein POTOM_014198 [Populus tomentosa]
MILLQSHSRFLLQTLLNRVQNLGKAVELDYHWVEFDDVRYHILVSMKNPNVLLLSVSLPIPPPEAVFIGGLPFGAIEALKAAYGVVVQILDPPRDGFNLTLKLNLGKLPLDEEHRYALLLKIASVREVVLGAPLRVVLKHLSSRTVIPGIDGLLALVHRSKESFFLVPQPDKVTVVFPMRFKDSIDIAFATSFLQEFVEARHTAVLNNAPPCLWSPNPPLELKEAPAEALSANAGFVSFVIFPRHVEGKKLDRTVWNLSTFHAYVSYHVKCSEGFMHTRMRRRVESMIQLPCCYLLAGCAASALHVKFSWNGCLVGDSDRNILPLQATQVKGSYLVTHVVSQALDRAKPGVEEKKKSPNSRSFKRLSLKEARANSIS